MLDHNIKPKVGIDLLIKSINTLLSDKETLSEFVFRFGDTSVGFVFIKIGILLDLIRDKKNSIKFLKKGLSILEESENFNLYYLSNDQMPYYETANKKIYSQKKH